MLICNLGNRVICRKMEKLFAYTSTVSLQNLSFLNYSKIICKTENSVRPGKTFINPIYDVSFLLLHIKSHNLKESNQ
jgi:hypothetical protein